MSDKLQLMETLQDELDKCELSSPKWFWTIDQAVRSLLTEEIYRARLEALAELNREARELGLAD